MSSPSPSLGHIISIPPLDDDDDMDYEPASESGISVDEESYDEEEDDDGDEVEYIDAEEGQDITVEQLLEAFQADIEDGSTPTALSNDGGEDDEGADEEDEGEDEEGREEGQQGPQAAAAGATPPAATERPMTLTRNDLLRLLAQSGAFQRFWRSDAATESPFERRREPERPKIPFPKIPSDAGRALMESGTFGTNERQEGQYKRKKKLAARIMRRELGLESPGTQRTSNRITSQGLIPSSEADTIVNYDNRCYSGQFSDDGNFFFSCSQDFKVRMYDTSNPYKWRHYRTVDHPFGGWTISDATLSPDNKFLASSSLKSIVCLAHTDPESSAEPYLLDFADLGNRRSQGRHGYSRDHFGIWSIRFSGDGSEIVAGTSDNSVYVYDLETRQSVLRIHGHTEDVNAVCYGDRSSPHILYSGSDDTTIKVWDRRSLGDQRAAGLFLGHTEGLTYVDSKGDGRYVLSNGKDQTMKLWDLRKMVSTEKAEQMDLQKHSTGFDYRYEMVPTTYNPHPDDCSIVTFRGHRVLKTLIRCHFSPPGSTDSRYVYSGSADGSVYIYNMDATIAGKLDVQKTTQGSRPRGGLDEDAYYFDDGGGGGWRTCVRDASWHPHAPVIAATSWNGYGMQNGTCTVHTWNDGLDEDEAEPAMRQRVNPELKEDRRFVEPPRGMRTRAARRARPRIDDDEDE